MNRVLRIALVLVGLALLGLGLGLVLTPTRAAMDFAVTPTAAAGLGTLRANLGGFFLAAAGFTLAGTRRGAARWLVVPATLLGLVLVLRLAHVALDGVSAGATRSIVAEIVFVGLLVAGWRRLRRAP